MQQAGRYSYNYNYNIMMYRIKNVRGSTIAKTHNVSPQLPLIPTHNPTPKVLPLPSAPNSQKLPVQSQPPSSNITKPGVRQVPAARTPHISTNAMTSIINKKGIGNGNPSLTIKDNKSAINQLPPRKINVTRNGIRPASRGIKVNATANKNIGRIQNNQKVQNIEKKAQIGKNPRKDEIQINQSIKLTELDKQKVIQQQQAQKKQFLQKQQKQEIKQIFRQQIREPRQKNNSQDHIRLEKKKEQKKIQLKQESNKQDENKLEVRKTPEKQQSNKLANNESPPELHHHYENMANPKRDDRNNNNDRHHYHDHNQAHHQPDHNQVVQPQQRTQLRVQRADRAPENSQNAANPISGMLHTTDPLSHFQFTDLIMDLQIKKILKTSFAHFPNGRQIEYKKQQLQRINTSYVLAKQANSILKDGLNGYRIQLFNQIGELIMSNINGATNSGAINRVNDFVVIQANHQSNLVPEATLTRGIPKDKISKVIKKTKNHQSGEEQAVCSICLENIKNGQEYYRLQCRHSFHPECCEDWVQISGNCPTCRKNLKF